MTDSSRGTALASGPQVAWRFKVGGSPTTWDWTQVPDPNLLEPIRRPASGAASKHIPVRAHSHTVGAHLALESGLEHDLLRVLDRDPDVVWLVPQPFELEWGIGKRRRHVPDLLSVGSDGTVKVWDIKTPQAATSARFVAVQELTERACSTVGWSYSVFTGLPAISRHNLLWLHAYRARPEWADRWEAELLAHADGGCRLGDLIGLDPERTNLMWHLIWTGRLSLDLTEQMGPASRVAS